VPTNLSEPGLAALVRAGTASEQTGTEDPHDVTGETPLVERAFSFVDLCRFTTFMTASTRRSMP
jgi:hypothetical protein